MVQEMAQRERKTLATAVPPVYCPTHLRLKLLAHCGPHTHTDAHSHMQSLIFLWML
ncbi:hypothetical protein L873DRAFT_1819607 [Choiromyces venosus 120613-1]|uniref:Uncharacterized protein n=1 Tax=Choiromyces venosus 120613-1 TaxID=1336337 RepID=A0A3N4J495_9PEZI|nr:hypothetical protein L873DRAFT_1819607 [Choiromyces venosus 120613-1]